MARKPTVEQLLAGIRTGALDALRAGLASSANYVVEAAAKRIAEDRVDAAVPELVAAFARLADDDPGCRGRIAIAHALHAVDHWDDSVFVAGLAIKKLEGPRPPDDTAAPLRGICGIAHAHFNRPDALEVLAALLADPFVAARLGAAQGLRDAGRLGSAALLRFKILIGDADPDVLAACVEALLANDRDEHLAFLLGLLAAHDQRAEIVALALGGARMAGDALAAWCDAARPEQRQRVAYVALALLRDAAANAKLLEAIRTRNKADAIAAARALATFKDDKVIAEIRAAAKSLEASVKREIEGSLPT